MYDTGSTVIVAPSTAPFGASTTGLLIENADAQSGWRSSAGFVVSCVNVPSATVIAQTSRLPPESGFVNAILVPSGDHDGDASSTAVVVVRRICAVPSAFIV